MGHGDPQGGAGQQGPYPSASPATAAGQQAGPYPYPPAQPASAGGVTAPGGYTVVSPSAGPSSGAYPPQPGSSAYPPQPSSGPYPPPAAYPPQGHGLAAAAGPSAGSSTPPRPHPDAMEPPQKPYAAQGPPPSGYPGAPSGYPGAGGYPSAGATGPYPPAGGAGYPPPPTGAGPAPGYPVMGTPAAAAASPIGGMSVQQGGVTPPGKERCSCSVGWVLFGVGFIFWPCWVAAAFIPLCTKSRSDRLAAIASTIGMLILVVLGVIIAATSTKWRFDN